MHRLFEAYAKMINWSEVSSLVQMLFSVGQNANFVAKISMLLDEIFFFIFLLVC